MKRLRRFFSAAAIIVAGFVLPFAALEFWVREKLFDYASYTNNVSFDATWRALQSAHDWNVVYFGNSEVRWGFSTDAFDARSAAAGLPAQSFNLGVDGLNFSTSIPLFDRLGLKRRFPKLKVAIIGVQLTDAHASYQAALTKKINCSSALMRPLLHSPWARDEGLRDLCYGYRPDSNRVLTAIEDVSATIRYRAQIKQLLNQVAGGASDATAFDSNGLAMNGDGYHPHLPMQMDRVNHNKAVANLQKEKSENPPNFSPMPADVWPTLVKPGELFDRWAQLFEAMDVVPVFVALPTNPERIDIANRREDYARNSAILADWANRTGRLYVDLGMQSYDGREFLYADHRHLSFIGAARYMDRLAAALSENAKIRAALSINGVDPLTGKTLPGAALVLYRPGEVGKFDSLKRGKATDLIERGGFSRGVLLTSRSTALLAAGDGDTTKLRIAPVIAEQVSGKPITLMIRARSAAKNGSKEMRVLYSRPGVSAVGWMSVALTDSYADHKLSFVAPADLAGAASNDLVAIWADPSGKGRGVEIERISLKIDTPLQPSDAQR